MKRLFDPVASSAFELKISDTTLWLNKKMHLTRVFSSSGFFRYFLAVNIENYGYTSPKVASINDVPPTP